MTFRTSQKSMSFARTLSILFLTIYSVSSCRHSTAPDEDAPNSANQHAISAIKSETPAKAVIYDIPSLLRLSSLQIRQKLGKPIDELEADAFGGERSLVYRNQGITLTADYFVENNKVDLITLSPAHDTSAFQFLLPLGNLTRSDTTYIIKPQPSDQEGLYHGIIIQPNPPIGYPNTSK